jgi:hypothetical protein
MNEPERLTDILEQTPRPGTATPDSREENFRRLIRAAMPTAEASDALRQRVRSLEAAAAAPRARSRFSIARLGWSLVALGAAMAVVAPFCAPRWVAAQTLKRIQAAFDDVRSAHEVYWRVAPDGSRKRAGETWYQAGRWRLVDLQRGRIDVFARGRLSTYDRNKNEVTVFRTSGPFGYNPSGFSLAAMTRDFARWGWRYEVRVLGISRIGGRSLRQVVIQRRDEERDLLQVDPVTALPVRSESQREVNRRWVTEGITESQFNQPLPAALFVPDFPVAAKHTDWDAGREIWRRRLAPGVARRRIAGSMIVIRELWVNAAGDVFVLYTAEYPPEGFYEDWRVDLVDDQGSRYHEAAGLYPYNFETKPVRAKGSNRWWGFTFSGQKLRGTWWVPAIVPHPWRSRQFTLTFHAMPKGGPERTAGPRSQARGEARPAVRGAVAIHADREGRTLVPPFMPYMFGLMDANQIEREEADARAAYLRQDSLQRYATSEGSRHSTDMQKALANYWQIVHMDEAQARKLGSAPHDPEVWTNIGRVLYGLGRTEEARAAFGRAIRESTNNDWSRQEPQQLLKGVNAVMAWTPGRPAPLASGTDLEGHPHSVTDYHGRVLLISLWNRFSHELPRIKAIDTHYRPKGLAVLGVCVDINRKDLKQFVQAQQLPWPNLYDDKQYQSEVAARFGYSWYLTRLPRTIVVDARGIVRAVDLHGPALDHSVAELLAGRLVPIRKGS